MDTDYLDIGFRLVGTARYVDAIDKYVNRKIIEQFWKKVVFPAAIQIKDSFDYIPLTQALTQYPIKGLINSIFRQDGRRITNLDIAVALYISIKGHASKERVPKTELIESASILTKAIINGISESKIYKRELKRLDKDYKDFSYKVHRDIVNETISSNKELFSHHFRSFEEESFHDFLKVYYPKDGQSWIDWEPGQTLTVNIDSTKIPEGFFLLGFDYANKEGHFLKKSYRKDGYEYFNKEINNGELIWAL